MRRISQILLVFYLLIVGGNCNGMVELLVSSPVTVLMSQTVCTNFRCGSMDPTARKSKVDAGMALRQRVAGFGGKAPRYYDLHVVIADLENEEIGYFGNTVDSTTQFQTINIETSQGFNVTFQYRVMCSNNFYGLLCDRFCEDSVEDHQECTPSGEKRCMHGWSGPSCLIPICSKSCAGRGKCVAPEQCRCHAGYSGTNCEVCTPKKGCVNGGCANNVSFTCQCDPGFGGALCTLDLDICSHLHPCLNNGFCQGANTPTGFRCQCPDEFTGERCELPCGCKNGGTCTSNGCQCLNGYSGRFCEFGGEVNEERCMETYCRNGGTCSLNPIHKKPICRCPTCYKGPKCEILDADCLLQQMNATIFRNSKAALNIHGGHHQTSNGMMIFIIAFLLSAIFFLSIAVLWISRRLRKPAATSPDTVVSDKEDKSVVKICVIDPELDNPPPAYYPPLPKYSAPIGGSAGKSSSQYQTLPTCDQGTSLSTDIRNLKGTNV